MSNIHDFLFFVFFWGGGGGGQESPFQTPTQKIGTTGNFT